MRVICVCTARQHHWLLDWLEAARKWGYTPVVLGQGVKWEGFGTKMSLVRKYVSKLPPGEIVAVVDCYDLLMTGPASELLRKFKRTKKKILVGAEKICGFNCIPLSVNTECSEKFANGGFLMGRAATVNFVYTEAQRKHPFDDQRGICQCINDNPGLFHIDHKQEFVCNLLSHHDLSLAPNGRFFHKKYKTYPCAVHMPFITRDLGRRNNLIRKHTLSGWRIRRLPEDWVADFGKRMLSEIAQNTCYDALAIGVLVGLLGLIVLNARGVTCSFRF